jgi:WD40 repeat protein
VRYDAFISYSHAADDALAPALQHGLQSLARPWNRRRALEIFRDDTGLAVSPGLWSSICAGLDESEYFVLLASPGAAESVWVNREIERWIASHPIDNLLPVVTDGEWVWDSDGDFDWDQSTAVPPALRGLFAEEPRHLDLQWARTENDLDLRNSRFRQAVAQLAAPMHSMTPQDLDSADVANYRRVVRLRRAVSLAMAILLVMIGVAGVFAVRSARDANLQRDLADKNAAEAEDQAQRATALRLVAQSEIERPRRKSLSILLSVEASLRDPAETWGSLIDGLQDAPGLTRVFDLPEHVARSTASAVSPDATVLAAPTAKGNVQLWDLSTGAAVGHRLKDGDLFPKSPTELVFSRTGLLAGHYSCISVALCTKEQIGHSTVVVWDPATRRPRQLASSDGFASPSFSADGRRVAAYAADGRVRVWDTARGSLIAAGSAADAATGVALSPNGSMVALASAESRHISTWRIDGRRLTARRTMVSAAHAPEAVTFSGNHMVASTARDGRVTVWDVTSGKSIGDLPSAGGVPVVDVASTLDGTLATVDARGVLRLWSAATQRPLGTPHPAGPAAQAGSVAFTSDGRLLSVGRDIRVWDLSHWEQSGSPLYRQPGGVTAMAMSPSGLLATAGPTGDIMLSQVGDQSSRSIHAEQGAITALAVRSDGLLASGGADGTVRLWNSDTAERVQTLPSNDQGSIAALAFSPDGADLAVGYHRGPHDPATDDLPVWVWPLASGEVTYLDAGLAERVSALAFASDGAFATAGEDHLTVYDSYDGENRVLAQHPGAFFGAIAFSPDGKTIASSGYREGQSHGDTAALWDVSTRAATRLPAGSSPGWDGLFRSLAFSPDGQLLGGAGAGGLQLWDVGLDESLGGLLRPLAATSVVFTPDGRSVVVADESGLVQTYPATIDGWRDAACAIVSRNLTESEWTNFVSDTEPYGKTCPQY